ncbi:MAG: peptidoglycan D,D-transpeptidase FtsI family protein [Patescibacteria group bacterium]
MSLWRAKTLMLGFCFFGFLVAGRLFYWQILQGEKLSSLASSQYSQEEEIPARRGQILTSDGFPLVTNKQAYLVYALLPQLDRSPEEISTMLAKILQSQTREEMEKKLKSKDLVWVSLARKVDREKKEEIQKLQIQGLGFEEEARRDYPEGSLAAQLVGFVGKDAAGKDKGYFGLEGFYDRELSGRPGILRQEKDASGRPILIGKRLKEEEIPGRDLELYLNREIQFMVERKLKKGLEKYGAKSGSVVIMDPKTGGILSMASFPSYEPANYAKTNDSLFPNPVISQTFEPGSIFKPLVMAAAINEGVVSPQDKCDRCSGPRQIGEYTIKTWDERYHPDSTMTEILEHSDNVGMVFVGEKLGTKNLVSYLKKFGIGEQTGIDLEGETVAVLRSENEWVPIDLATASFGQGVALTPIQMVRAIAAVANGGEMLEPHVVTKIKTQDKELEIKPKVRRRVISLATARVITEMMVNAVERGGKWERPKGFRIAGKTGTAQIPIAGHYDKEKTIVSFVGFAPADNPRFVMLVTMREPTLIWGSMTVAPLWFEIAKELFYYLGIPPSF